MTIEELIASLTASDVADLNATQDKLIWIETNLLDPHNLPRHLAIRVEEALIAMGAQ